ncbi:hypothetical protein [Acetonema longum]|uniref:Uncharacterized protein n=1 Tax=Acetonema longum DSM 6540 TaxID=1009370 RepID=F7NK85_9FIRM|nr:hypothetical protein [Acetonema longum]EGO63526.1 hypothetical protein ALO_12491 [Acetonema longum DSM 6540]
MKSTIQFETITDILSEELYQTRYMIGQIDEKHYIYIWTCRTGEEVVEVSTEMLNSPAHDHGAMIGTAQEIADHIEVCVGLHRDDPDEVTAEAAEEVVAELREALGL